MCVIYFITIVHAINIVITPETGLVFYMLANIKKHCPFYISVLCLGMLVIFHSIESTQLVMENFL